MTQAPLRGEHLFVSPLSPEAPAPALLRVRRRSASAMPLRLEPLLLLLVQVALKVKRQGAVVHGGALLCWLGDWIEAWKQMRGCVDAIQNLAFLRNK